MRQLLVTHCHLGKINICRFANHINLLARVCTVSVETQRIIAQMNGGT